jgi:hypothetical protein
MPIGFDGGGAGPEPVPPEPVGDGTDTITWPEVEAIPLIPIVWTSWHTTEDERVCPECGPLDGLTWEATDGPMPPLHVNCRCTRVYAFTEYRVRT